MENLLRLLDRGPELCAQWMPSGPYAAFYRALVCGVSLPDGDERRLLLDAGLIHIIVVSGAHLYFLDSWLPRRARTLRYGVLSFYCWLTGFGPPVVRAFVRRVVEEGVGRHLTSLQQELVTVVSIFLICPHWLASRSFLMSWLCGLALSLPQIGSRFAALQTGWKCYVLLFPFCAATPLSILFNTIVTPILGGIVFPLAILAALLPFLQPAIDEIWRCLFLILSSLPFAPPAPWFLATRLVAWIPLVLHLLLLWGEVQCRRVWAFSR